MWLCGKDPYEWSETSIHPQNDFQFCQMLASSTRFKTTMALQPLLLVHEKGPARSKTWAYSWAHHHLPETIFCLWWDPGNHQKNHEIQDLTIGPGEKSIYIYIEFVCPISTQCLFDISNHQPPPPQARPAQATKASVCCAAVTMPWLLHLQH